MSSTKNEKNDDNKLYKKPFSTSQLILGLLFGTYFLTVQTIELSLSTYVLQKDKNKFYNEYLMFKSQAPIWKWWQLFSTLIVLLSIIDTFRDLFQTLTRKATNKRHLLDILKAFQLVAALYISITRVLPLEKKLIETNSIDNLYELNFLQWILFLLNILGWSLPLFRYQEWINDERIHSKKKIQ